MFKSCLPISRFHLSCLCLKNVSKTCLCPHCRKLPKFGRGKKGVKKGDKIPSQFEEALSMESICVCKKKTNSGDKLLKCHNASCLSGRFSICSVCRTSATQTTTNPHVTNVTNANWTVTNANWTVFVLSLPNQNLQNLIFHFHLLRVFLMMILKLSTFALVKLSKWLNIV